jgi:Protein of unknown function (DUF1579)
MPEFSFECWSRGAPGSGAQVFGAASADARRAGCGRVVRDRPADYQRREFASTGAGAAPARRFAPETRDDRTFVGFRSRFGHGDASRHARFPPVKSWPRRSHSELRAPERHPRTTSPAISGGFTMSVRTRTLTSCSAILLILALSSPALAAKAKETAKPGAEAAKPATTAAPPAMDPATAEMMKNGTPGEAHAKLKLMEGKFKAVTKYWSGPGDPQVSEGVSENRLIFGGRYLEQRFTGAMMGMPFEGYGLTGYDNAKGQYQTFWIDNMSTAMQNGTGAMDASGREMTCSMMTVGNDGKPMQAKTVTRLVDDNTQVFSMYGDIGGKDVLFMEITYTRQ